jgi:hypothetical protein
MSWIRRAARRYWVVTLTIGVGLAGIVLWAVGWPSAVQWLFSGYALAVAIWQGIGMVREIVRGHWGLDVLAVTAIVSTVLVGEYVAALLVVLMLTGGEALEDFANRRAKRELDALLTRSPQAAHRLDGDEIVEVDANDVVVGDRLIVRPSEIVPVDAVLVSPATDVDESAITGESVPVEKRAGDRLLSGSVNGTQAIEVRAEATAGDSQYQKIVALVEGAAASKAPVVRLADRFAVPFTVFSLALGAVAWWLSGDPVRFAEVLVLATPCPLLIAAPVAYIGGMSRAARNGLVVKSGGVLEQLSAARTAVFDKTGTLTYGEPELAEIRPEAGLSADEVLGLVASAEQYSSHVLATSMIDAAKRRGIPLAEATEAREAATNGVQALIDGRDVVVGKLAFVQQHAPAARRTAIAPGQLAIYVGVDGRYAGALLASDRVRADDDADRGRPGDSRPHRRRDRHRAGPRRLPTRRQGARDRRDRGATRDHGRRRGERRTRARRRRCGHRDGCERRHGGERVGGRRRSRGRALAGGEGRGDRPRHRAHRAAEHLARHPRQRRAHARRRLRRDPRDARRGASGGGRSHLDPRCPPGDRRTAGPPAASPHGAGSGGRHGSGHDSLTCRRALRGCRPR